MYLSIIVPLYNEEDSIAPLIERFRELDSTFDFSYEIILVDDGSTDKTWEFIDSAVQTFSPLRGLKFKGNCGQTAAMVAGFDHAKGEFIVTMDGDLQNDPGDIPLLLKKMEEGWDIVSGWRADRKDHWSRVFPSQVANGIISFTTGVKLHDYGCSLKVYRADCVKALQFYGEMHRFFPALASMTGARVTEIPVSHHARQFGESKYGMNRIFKVFSDIFAINLIIRFSSAPLKGFALTSLPFFGLMMFFFILSFFALILGWSAGKSLFFMIVGTLSMVGGVQLLALGVLGELVIWTSDLSHTRLAEVTSQLRFLNKTQEKA